MVENYSWVKKRKPITISVYKYFIVYAKNPDIDWSKPNLKFIESFNFYPNQSIRTEKQFCLFLLRRYGVGLYRIAVSLPSIRRKYGIVNRGFHTFWYGYIEKSQFKRTKGSPQGYLRCVRMNQTHTYFDSSPQQIQEEYLDDWEEEDQQDS